MIDPQLERPESSFGLACNGSARLPDVSRRPRLNMVTLRGGHMPVPEYPTSRHLSDFLLEIPLFHNKRH